MSLPVLLFAAGFGTRMRPLTNDRPKPLIPVAGRPLIDHTLDLAHAVAPPRIAANLHYRAEMLQAHLEPLGVRCVIEAPAILETGGGLRNARDALGTGPVVTLNTDAIWKGPNPVAALLAAWDPEKMDALLMGVPPTRALEHAGAGDFTRAPDGRLTRGPGLVFGGAQIIKPEGLDAFAETSFSLNLLWDRMLAEDRLFGLQYEGHWCDVGHPGGIATAVGLINDTL
ncbi:nucleotidyltransferase family protein [Sulfitobacter albidus]|uniref:Nucleotidyltransferase family protein n=1 Tax=Sulfitobacter albidus TaxID=2829501 RepID=A0A975JDB6_9RHOB|nr:nucleotidyltransferase family protein [Sulfitobacter albidus]QUJ76165.1 nucleotidyltransferase family protein [Sulfitobacter albidus]